MQSISSSLISDSIIAQDIQIASLAPQSSKSYRERTSIAEKVANVVKFIPVFSAPFALHKVVKEARLLSRKSEKIDIIMRLMEGLAWLGDSIGLFLHGLKLTTSVAATVVAVAWHFYAGSTVLWLASIYLNAKNIVLSRKFKSQLSLDSTRITFQQNLGQIVKLENYKFKNYFGLSPVAVKPILSQLGESSGKYQQNRVMRELDKRIDNKNFSRKIAILASIINFVSMSILLLTALTPIGYGLLALGFIIAITSYCYDKWSSNRTIKNLEEIAAKATPYFNTKFETNLNLMKKYGCG